MQILLNGKRFATEASNLDELCARLGLRRCQDRDRRERQLRRGLRAQGTTKLAEAAEVEIVAPRQGG